MLFTLKKYIGGMMLPLPLLLIIIALGLALVWFSRFQKSGKTLITFGWLVLLLLSLQPVADGLLRPIENRYPTWQGNQKVAYIVVLGGGYTWDPDWAPSSNLINNSLPRLNEGIRLWLANPGSKMIFTGAAAKTNPVSTAEAGARVAESLGVPRSSIITLDSPKDTEEEAAAVKQAIGEAPFLLVTSASHLPRAMIFFEKQSLHPLPAPANQMAIDAPLNPWERVIPSPMWLMHSDRVGYETLGRLWQWLKGSSGEPGQE
ncbi:envelope biogenesis factor ElyC [Enterobacter roggenkampii]|uniref:envelope biogenesis factor ElyC n=1 Tax=Enterobacter roggenkampii TaxID=1812935 RepID=UPI002002FD49|nr:envelope biogenesis factor ElyC [Enterobacter roggenkampii]MCK6872728.1 envelope biogenesis factor ElyC [Enterobacter roggenkampii]